MESPATSNRNTTPFWLGLAMFGPPLLALVVRMTWSTLGAEPAHGIAIELPSTLPVWSTSPEVITAGFGLTPSQLLGAFGLAGLATSLRRLVTRR